MNILNKELTLDFVNEGKPFTIYYEIDRFIKEVLIEKEYEDLLKLSPVFDKKELVVMDLGCNIGSFSMYIYDKAKHIYSIDLSKNCISLLNQTLEHNKFDKITTYQKAIAGSNRLLRVTSLEVTDGGNSIYGGGDEVQAVTLATFFKELEIDHIDLLKIDVESAEQEIFGSEDFKEISNKIDVIIGEVHGGANLGVVLGNNGFSYTEKYPHFLAMKR